MKRFYRYFILTSLIIFILSITLAKDPNKERSSSGLKKLTKINTNGDYTIFDVNNISTYIRNNGSFNRNPGTGNAGFEWPKGSGNTAIYASGLWLGGKTNDTIRVAVAEYSYEYQAGPIGLGINPADLRWHVYKIKRGDNALNNQDYADWPFDDGAPAVKNYLGTADSLDGSGNRIPLLIGDMTAWTVFNDNDHAIHTNMKTPPLGIEVQLTAFGYNNSGTLGNTLFYKWKLINKSDKQIDSAYICIWADIDIGGGAFDYDGCDTLLGLGYTYSGASTNGQYGSTPPAAGFDFLQGPIVPGNITDTVKLVDGRIFPGKKMLKMTSYLKYDNDNSSDLGNPFTGQEVYNYFRCLTRSGLDVKGPDSVKTMFMLSGDPNLPLSTTNWIEGAQPPGDRRFMMTSGPFTMQAGDTQEVIAANLIAQGSSNLNSVTALKNADASVQSLFDINTPPMPTMTIDVSYPDSMHAELSILSDAHASGTATMVATLKRRDQSVVTAIMLYDDGSHNDGSAHDGIFGNYAIITREPQGLYLDLQIQDSLGRTHTWEHFYDYITTIGPIDLIGAPVIFSDNLNNDFHVNPGENIRYGFSIQNNTGSALSNLTITPSNLFTTESMPITTFADDSIFSIQSNNYFDFQLAANYDDTTYQISVAIQDINFNRWAFTLPFRVYLFAQPIYGKPLIHSAGRSDWGFNATMVDPSIINDHTYELSFTGSGDSSRTMSLQDLNTHSFLFSGEALPDSLGHSLPYTDGFKIMGGTGYGRTGIDYVQSWMWISASQPWFQGITFGTYAVIGVDIQNFTSYVESSFNPVNSVPVEIRFDPANPQKAYRLIRIAGSGYLILSYDNVPFSVWDISDSLNPRQITVAWRDYDSDGTWSISTDFEYTFIYYRTYDPTGTQFSSAVNECTIGAKADIMYGIQVSLISGHVINESTGKMYLRPYLSPTSADRYIFNPANVDVGGVNTKPRVFSLDQNYPNPFNPSTTIQFKIPSREMVRLKIYNVLGQEIADLIDGLLESGDHRIEWNGRNKNDVPMASGVYFYRLVAGKFSVTKKMILLK